MKDSEHLEWIHDRIINVYGESENVDFLIKLRKIIKKTKESEPLKLVLTRLNKFILNLTTVSQFEVECKYRQNKIKRITSKNNIELIYDYREVYGEITIYEDVNEIIVYYDRE